MKTKRKLNPIWNRLSQLFCLSHPRGLFFSFCELTDVTVHMLPSLKGVPQSYFLLPVVLSLSLTTNKKAARPRKLGSLISTSCWIFHVACKRTEERTKKCKLINRTNCKGERKIDFTHSFYAVKNLLVDVIVSQLSCFCDFSPKNPLSTFISPKKQF